MDFRWQQRLAFPAQPPQSSGQIADAGPAGSESPAQQQTSVPLVAPQDQLPELANFGDDPTAEASCDTPPATPSVPADSQPHDDVDARIREALGSLDDFEPSYDPDVCMESPDMFPQDDPDPSDTVSHDILSKSVIPEPTISSSSSSSAMRASPLQYNDDPFSSLRTPVVPK
eukprot:2053718-Pyramimonas_sp.AAC.2